MAHNSASGETLSFAILTRGVTGPISASHADRSIVKDQDEPIYTISIAARLVRPIKVGSTEAKPLHAQTLRMYEREGLVKPKRAGRNRLYSDRDIERLRQIQYLTQVRGVNLAGVEIILEMMEELTALRASR